MPGSPATNGAGRVTDRAGSLLGAPMGLAGSLLTAPTRVAFMAAAAARKARQQGMRGARVFHPDGVGFEGELTVAANSPAPDGTLLGDPGTYNATIRLSRGAGLPQRLPDILGVAIRLPDVYGADHHQDLLLATSLRINGGRHTLFPGTKGFFGSFYSSLLPYDVGGETLMLGVDPGSTQPTPWDIEGAAATATGRRLTLCVASVFGGSWAAAARLTIGDRLPDAPVEIMKYDPANTGGGLRPAPRAIHAWRSAAYEGSQAGRLR